MKKQIKIIAALDSKNLFVLSISFGLILFSARPAFANSDATVQEAVNPQAPVISIQQAVTKLNRMSVSAVEMDPLKGRVAPFKPSGSLTPVDQVKIVGMKPYLVRGAFKGMQFDVEISGEIAGYRVWYKDKITDPWKLAEDQIPASQTHWIDNGIRTSPAPVDVPHRFYQVTPLTGLITDVSIPQDGLVLDSPYYVATYRFTDGTAAPVDRILPVTLSPGLNTISITERTQIGTEIKTQRQIRYEAPELTLTETERQFWQRTISENAKFFVDGGGIHTASGFPYDYIGTNSPGTAPWTQPTSIGFYLQFLADVISRKMTVAGLTPEEAIVRAKTTLTSLRTAQSQSYAYKGLLPWMKFSGSTVLADRTKVVFLDNINLSQSIAAFLGTLGKTNLNRTSAKEIYDLGLAFLEAQRGKKNGCSDSAGKTIDCTGGYEDLYDASTGLLHFDYDTQTQLFSGYQDIYSNEVRSGVAFAVSYFGIPRSAWDKLTLRTSAYETFDKKSITTITPYVGAFHVFWNTLRAPEQELLPNVMWNSLAIYMDFMQRNGLPGFPSTSSVPEGGYKDSGIANFQYFIGTQIRDDIGAPYALASAYIIAPQKVISYLQWVKSHFPAMSGNLGLYDAGNAANGVSRNFYAIDQGALIVGLAGNGPSGFTWFLNHAAASGSNEIFKGLYQDLAARVPFPRVDLIPNPEAIPRDTGSVAALSVFKNIQVEGTVISFPPPTKTTDGAYQFRFGKLPQNWGGYYWKLSKNFDVRGKKMVLDYTIVDSPKQIKLEIKNVGGGIIYSTYLNLSSTPGRHQEEITLDQRLGLQNVGEIVMIIEQQLTKDTSADFTLHSLEFVAP